MVISETKLDDSFPESQFKIPGYSSPFRLDWHQNGGSTMVSFQSSRINKPIEALFIKLNFQKKKRLLSCSDNPSENNISNHLQRYENNMGGDFNVSPEESLWKHFVNLMG